MFHQPASHTDTHIRIKDTRHCTVAATALPSNRLDVYCFLLPVHSCTLLSLLLICVFAFVSSSASHCWSFCLFFLPLLTADLAVFHLPLSVFVSAMLSNAAALLQLPQGIGAGSGDRAAPESPASLTHESPDVFNELD